MDESELIRRCQQGEVACFNRLIENYQTCVYNLALRMLANVQVAEDATQDTFVSAWRGIRGFRGGNFRAWLLQIAANACRDQLRRLKRYPAVSLDASLVILGEPASPTEHSPEDVAERRMFGEEIQKGLATLLPDQRLAVVLSDIQGLSYEEIANVMGVPVGTVRSRISRGRQHLRDYLLQQGELFSQRLRLNR